MSKHDDQYWRDLYEERAAILEYDAGFARAKAEALARQEVKKLKEQEQ